MVIFLFGDTKLNSFSPDRLVVSTHEQKNWKEAAEQMGEVAKAIERLAVYLEQL